MRATPELTRLPAVMDGDGQLLPFDRGRLGAALRRALLGDAVGAGHVAEVITAYLGRREQSPVIAVPELARLAERVLIAVGEGQAARCFRRPRAAEAAARPVARAALAALLDGAGPAAGGRLARDVAAAHVRANLLGATARLAERRGLLDLSGCLDAARVPGAVLPMDWLAPRRGPALGTALRGVLELVAGELVLPWNGPAPDRSERTALQALEPVDGGTTGRLVVVLPARAWPKWRAWSGSPGPAEAGVPRLVLRFLGAPPQGGLPWGTALAECEVARCAPPAGADRALASLDLAACARLAGRRPGAFLELVEDLASEAAGAMSQIERSGMGALAGSRLVADLGPASRLRLELAGWAAAAGLLLGDRDGDLGDELASSLGERLRRGVSAVRRPVVVSLASADRLAGWASADPPARAAARLTRRRALLGLADDEPLAVPAGPQAAAQVAAWFDSRNSPSHADPCA